MKLNLSFFAKISLVFLTLVLFLGVSISFLGVNSSLRFVEETNQKINRNVANEIASLITPFLQKEIEADSIQSKIKYLKGINPQADVYLLSSEGRVKKYFLGNDTHHTLVKTQVDTKPLNDFIAGADLPIVSVDPLNPTKRKPFSAANVEIMGESGCYLYVILGGQEYEEAAGLIKDSYILKSSVIALVLILISTIILGLILFNWLTQRLKNMRNVVIAFEQGQLDQRLEVDAEDEIGCLAKSFNQMAETIVQNMDEIKQVDKLRRELVANVSHDLRSPLASIQGYLETIQIKDKTITSEERTRYLDIVLKNTRKLNKLVAELFELSKLDAQDVKPDLELVSIAELVQDVVYQFQPQAQAKNIQLVAHIPQEPLNLVYADIALMERALANLLDNALKNTSEGGRVSVSPVNDKNQICVNVTDTGKGIAKEDIKRIFDRFYQVDKSRTPGNGVGLGLSITQKILELHGSQLSVESALNRGTTFSFSLSSNRN